MLTHKQKIRLMLMYLRPALIISGLGSIIAFAFIAISDLETLTDLAMFLSMLKLAILGTGILLSLSMQKPEKKYFYINLGTSPKQLILWGVALDLAIYFIILLTIIIVRYAIQ
jgi:hypothetical protein